MPKSSMSWQIYNIWFNKRWYKNGNINQLIKLINLIINNKDILFDLKKNTFLYSRKFSLNKTVEGFLNAINSWEF